MIFIPGEDDLYAAMYLVAEGVAIQVILSGFAESLTLLDLGEIDGPASVVVEPYQQRPDGTWDLLVRQRVSVDG